MKVCIVIDIEDGKFAQELLRIVARRLIPKLAENIVIANADVLDEEEHLRLIRQLQTARQLREEEEKEAFRRSFERIAEQMREYQEQMQKERENKRQHVKNDFFTHHKRVQTGVLLYERKAPFRSYKRIRRSLRK